MFVSFNTTDFVTIDDNSDGVWTVSEMWSSYIGALFVFFVFYKVLETVYKERLQSLATDKVWWFEYQEKKRDIWSPLGWIDMQWYSNGDYRKAELMRRNRELKKMIEEFADEIQSYRNRNGVVW